MFPGTILDFACHLSSLSLVKRELLCGHSYNVKLWLPQRNLGLLSFCGSNFYVFFLSLPSSFLDYRLNYINLEYHRPKKTYLTKARRSNLNITQPEISNPH